MMCSICEETRELEAKQIIIEKDMDKSSGALRAFENATSISLKTLLRHLELNHKCSCKETPNDQD
jgi:hypothetical protein